MVQAAVTMPHYGTPMRQLYKFSWQANGMTKVEQLHLSPVSTHHLTTVILIAHSFDKFYE
jgi:hypothetical protein